ncbi:anti-repressor SinI family protein [Niallia nealsonii]|uniref:SinR repressor domain-containing protein dimerization n=1 Tax=Niallia nealsonii TaxID=115979 RepID=A0A2N0YZA0_9BACI|nr:anti-repressor SinI family protein [Niallia nealsonii]PKG22596.1 SinR repressor domain-containing protein dimerization [Niallia nealsonii]
MSKTQDQILDSEWIELILEAKAMGITEEEIKKFLKNYDQCDDLNLK